MNVSHLAVCLGLVAAPCSAHDSSEREAMNTFEKFISKAAAKTESDAVQFSAHQGKWAHAKINIQRPSYDIRRSDSLLSPYIAEVRFTHVQTFSGWHSTESAAEAAEIDPSKKTVYENVFRYAYTKGSWRLTSAQQCMREERRCLFIELSHDTLSKSLLSMWLP